MTHPLLAATGVSIALAYGATAHGTPHHPDRPTAVEAAPVIHWSNEARQAIIPPGPNGVFGTENYGNKFPGEAAVYMGIVHAAIYDAALAIEGGYEPYAIAIEAPRHTSAAAAVATAAHHTLIGLQPALGLTPAQQAVLDARYADYLAALPDTSSKARGIAVGARVAQAVLELREGDGRERNPQLEDLDPPPPGPGVWSSGGAAAQGLRLPGMKPLALESASQFRPDGPLPLSSRAYAIDFEEVAALGRVDSVERRPDQTAQALFWTDHDLRQWNDGMLALAADTRLGLVETARMLALAHVAGGDAMIACFDAKYSSWFWRPSQAIPQADTDDNAKTEADPDWQPLRPTPAHPEYPSAHACHTTAVSEALQAFFGPRRVAFTLDSRATMTTHRFHSFREVIRDVNEARILAGFHYRHSDEDGSALGRRVARYVVRHRFRQLE